ncbi:MAG: GIY-YIG nuclease family protein [Patescibacteria group bacterium]
MVKFNRTQKFTKTNIKKLPEDKAIVYKIKNATGKNLYTGIAGRGRGQDRLLEHKEIKKEKISGGSRFQFAQIKNKPRAEQIEKQIIKKEQPKFNIKEK